MLVADPLEPALSTGEFELNPSNLNRRETRPESCMAPQPFLPRNQTRRDMMVIPLRLACTPKSRKGD